MIHDAKRPRAQGTRKRGPRASARSEVRNVLEFRLMRMHFAYLSVRARARKVRASADQGPKLGQRNIGQRPDSFVTGIVKNRLQLARKAGHAARHVPHISLNLNAACRRTCRNAVPNRLKATASI